MLSIVIPVHHTESIAHIINTLDGIRNTIGVPESAYTITLVGTLPKDFFKSSTNTAYNLITTEAMLGDAKNAGAEYAIAQFKPDILVFMDAHTNFFDRESRNWGQVITAYLAARPDHIISPAISLYDNPGQRGFGVISEITEDNMTMDLKWKWWGSPNGNPNAPFEVPGLCGCFMAMTPETFKDSIVGFTPPLAIDDREFSIRMWTLGKTLVSLPALTVGHRFSSGYTDFGRKRSIEWGVGMLLYAYLNMDSSTVLKLYEKGISATQDKNESLRLATSPYWQVARRKIQERRVRTAEQYFRRFAQE